MFIQVFSFFVKQLYIYIYICDPVLSYWKEEPFLSTSLLWYFEWVVALLLVVASKGFKKLFCQAGVSFTTSFQSHKALSKALFRFSVGFTTDCKIDVLYIILVCELLVLSISRDQPLSKWLNLLRLCRISQREAQSNLVTSKHRASLWLVFSKRCILFDSGCVVFWK